MPDNLETLLQAAREMREAPVQPDALRRAETVLAARVRRPSLVRPLLLSAGGLSVLGVIALAIAPSRVSASELRRILGNADKGLRRMRIYEIAPDGSSTLVMDWVAQNGRRRIVDRFGGQALFDGHVLTRLYPDGRVTRERSPVDPSQVPPPSVEGSALAVLEPNAEGAPIRVEHGAVDRYTVDRDFKDSKGDKVYLHLTLEADPKTSRPLKMVTRRTGLPDGTITWEYPADDPSLFRLPIGPDTPVYDLDAQRATVRRQLASAGRKATVGGKTVELLGLWVDENGQAAAVARADYAYPYDYGLRIEGFNSGFKPEKPPFSGQWMVQEPTPTRGGATQVFSLNRPPNAGRLHYPDFVNVKVPVCEGKRLLGYARFGRVPVHRADQVYFLRPDNRAFWDERPRGPMAEAKAVDEAAKPSREAP